MLALGTMRANQGRSRSDEEDGEIVEYMETGNIPPSGLKPWVCSFLPQWHQGGLPNPFRARNLDTNKSLGLRALEYAQMNTIARNAEGMLKHHIKAISRCMNKWLRHSSPKYDQRDQGGWGKL